MSHKAVIARQDVEPLPAVDATLCTRDEVKRLIAEAGGQAVTVSGGDNIAVTEETAGDQRSYTVALSEQVQLSYEDGGDFQQSLSLSHKGVHLHEHNNGVYVSSDLAPGILTGLTNTRWDPTGVVSDRAATEGQLQAIANGQALHNSGDWLYRLDADSFEAWYSATRQNITITQASGNLYRSDQLTLTLPTEISGAGLVIIRHALVNAMHYNYPVWGVLASLSGASLAYYAVSGSSRSATPNYTVTAYVLGTIER